MADPTDRSGRPGDDDRKGEEGLSSYAKGYRTADVYLGASFSLVAAVGVFTALGIWIDRKLHTTVPWFTILGAAVGMTGGFISFFKTVLRKRSK
jgi:ATP synthase protein I